MGISAALAASTLGATPALAHSSGHKTTPQKVGIEVLKVDGTGCEEGTTSVALSQDNEAFTVTNGSYVVHTDGDENDASKDCKIRLKIRPPAGYAFTVFKADYRGFAILADDVKLTLNSGFSFGDDESTEQTIRFAGPLSDDWAVSQNTPTVWGSCGVAGKFNVSTELTVADGKHTPSDSVSVATMDSFDGSVQSTYYLGWKTCR